MKTLLAELTKSTTNVYGDTSKTFHAGRVQPKTFLGQDVLSPPVCTFADVNTAFGVAPGHCIVNPATGRKFELQNVATNTPTILYFTFDLLTGTWAFVGKIIMTLPVGSHAYRGFDFDDSDVNNIKVFISSTVTTALCQGGTFYTWNLTLADFTIGGTTIPLATGSNQKAVYFAQYAGQVGLLHQGITSGGVVSGRDFATPALKTRFFQSNGAAATFSIYGFDYSLGNPSVDGAVTNGIESKTTVFAGTTAYFRMGASQNGYSTTIPSAAAFEGVVLFNGTTNVPANFVASPFGTAQTVYYMRDLQFVSGQWYFNLATTAAGAAVVPTTNSATFSMVRQGGISSSHSLLKTGILTPAILGTLLQSNCFGSTTPTAVPSNAGLNGQDCIFFASNTTVYLGKATDLTDAMTTWPSLTPSNILGNGLDYVAPTAAFACYSTYLDRWVIVTNTSKFIVKKHLNNSIDRVIGSLSTLYMETKNLPSVPFGLAAIVTLTAVGGWFFITGSSIGQRGVVAIDLRSDDMFDFSYIITKVLQVPPGSVLRFISTNEAGADYTGDCKFYLKNGASASDPVFSNPSTGWTEVFPYEDNSPAALGPFFQLKVTYDVLTDSKNISPAQLIDVAVGYDEPGEIDQHFTWDNERSTKSGDSPMAVSIRQEQLFAAAPTKFVLEGRDDQGNVQVTIDSLVSPSALSCSSNGGSTFAAFTSMANFMSAFNSASGNTIVKFTIASPPDNSLVPYLKWSFKYV